jgi:CHASE2 domain
MRLKVFRVEKVCFFELAWGQGQQMTAQIPYPETLTQLYEHWQVCYLDFYRTSLRSVALPPDLLPDIISTLPEPANPTEPNQPSEALRGRIKNSGTLSAAPIDYRSRLVSAEAAFLAEFYDWLKSRELLDIRSKIAHLSQQSVQSQQSGTDLFLTCEPLALARFPWEVWEILGEFGQRSSLRIIRTPANLRHLPTTKPRSGKMRMLVILGDETGLSFQSEITALKSLERFAEVQFEGWHVGEPIAGLKERIAQRLVDPVGWDILFFAGHSNESVLTGGELAIAPQTSIFLKEIQSQLLKAKENGLQFAIFNSCKGLNLANTLIDLGLSQVAIMREPIHNSVAQDFLIQFIQHLMPESAGEASRNGNREPKNVYDALDQACQYLKLDRNLTYPSAYFIPSFFCHPETRPFTPRVLGIQQKLRSLLPSRHQAIALGAIAFATAVTPIQDLLLDGRLVSQSIYRHVTHQIPSGNPKIKIVQIDDASIDQGLIPPGGLINPMNRSALARIVDGIGTASPKVLAIDYVLDRALSEDPILAKSLAKAQSRDISLVFGSLQNTENLGITSTLRSNLDLNPNKARNGQIEFYFGYQPVGCDSACPFGLAIADQYFKKTSDKSPLDLKRDWRSFLQSMGIMAFSPITDYSIPNDRVYTTTSAMGVLGTKFSKTSQEPIFILAAGDYREAGTGNSTVTEKNNDKFSVPGAINYWRLLDKKSTISQMTGAEIHAYSVYQAINRRSVTPIPDILLVGLAAILGAGLQARRRFYPAKQFFPWNIFLTAAIYGGIGLQAFISAGLLLPWLWPSLTLWLYQSPLLNSTHIRKRLP